MPNEYAVQKMFSETNRFFKYQKIYPLSLVNHLNFFRVFSTWDLSDLFTCTCSLKKLICNLLLST